MKIYNLLENISSYKDENLYIDICKYTWFLDIFEILELMSFILSKYQNEKILKINLLWNCEVISYLERINFKSNLEKLFWIKKDIIENTYTWNNNLLQEIKVFLNKNEFYSINEKILTMFSSIWLNDDTSYLVLSSLWEIIDNSFFHNLWRWNTYFWPVCIFLAQNYSSKRKLSFVISDLWVWFKNTLKSNHPWLNNEKEYIEIALKPWITWRYENKWWNWLVYLQKNIFNWFNWELFIRSNEELVKVESFWKLKEIQNNIKIVWTSINFNLFY